MPTGSLCQPLHKIVRANSVFSQLGAAVLTFYIVLLITQCN